MLLSVARRCPDHGRDHPAPVQAPKRLDALAVPQELACLAPARWHSAVDSAYTTTAEQRSNIITTHKAGASITKLSQLHTVLRGPKDTSI